MPLSCATLQRPLHRGIARAREAHIDHARALVGRPIETLEDVEGRALGAGRPARERVNGVDLRRRRDRPSAGDAPRSRPPCRCRAECGLSSAPTASNCSSDRAFEIGMLDVDLRVDDRDRDVGALHLPVDVDQAELAERILRGVAFLGAAGEIGILRQLRGAGAGAPS